MRSRFVVPASALAAVACAAAPGVASARPAHHPVHNRALTIHATPSHVVAGDPVFIYGQLKGRFSANQTIHLWHRIAGQPRFTLVSTTKTDASGRYEFTRAEGVVETNRNWFVRGPVYSHSKTIHERVAAEVSLTPSANEGTTRHALTFSGSVSPNHAGEPIKLQVQRPGSDDWRTVKTGRIGAGSKYSIAYAWRTEGPRLVRTRFAGDHRNTAAASDPSAVVIDQRQAPYFTIGSSDAVVSNGGSTTVSGTVDKPHTSTPESGATVQLFARVPGTRPYKVVQTTTTGSNGGYSFTVQTTTNELYVAKVASDPSQHSAVLFQGVQDALTIGSSAATSTVGGTVTLSGTVAPDKTGQPIYLQKLGKDGKWHTVEVAKVGAGSRYAFNWRFGTAGTKQFRARVLGDGSNVGGASGAATVTVSQPPVSSLPTG